MLPTLAVAQDIDEPAEVCIARARMVRRVYIVASRARETWTQKSRWPGAVEDAHREQNEPSQNEQAVQIS